MRRGTCLSIALYSATHPFGFVFGHGLILDKTNKRLSGSRKTRPKDHSRDTIHLLLKSWYRTPTTGVYSQQFDEYSLFLWRPSIIFCVENCGFLSRSVTLSWLLGETFPPQSCFRWLISALWSWLISDQISRWGKMFLSFRLSCHDGTPLSCF